MQRVQMSRKKQLFLFFAVGLLLTFVWSVIGSAKAQIGEAVTKKFSTSQEEATIGAVVAIDQSTKNTVKLASTTTADDLAGVIVERVDEPKDSSQKVEVVVNGVVNALVSNINGDIHIGDKITASPIKGVGMKATENTQVFGTAQTDLKLDNSRKEVVTDRHGHKQTVLIGQVSLQVDIAYYVPPEKDRTVVPAFLQELANSVAGQNVSLMRIVVSSLVLLLGFVSIGTLLYASVRSSIISIGRNPLSQNAVHKSLLEVAGIAIIILLVMLGAIYLVLTV